MNICFMSDVINKCLNWMPHDEHYITILHISSLSYRSQYQQTPTIFPLLWCHNGRDGVSNHQPHYCLLNRLFKRRSKKTSKLCVTGLCAGNSPVTGEFPTQMASNAENVSIWWCHHAVTNCNTNYDVIHDNNGIMNTLTSNSMFLKTNYL